MMCIPIISFYIFLAHYILYGYIYKYMGISIFHLQLNTDMFLKTYCHNNNPSHTLVIGIWAWWDLWRGDLACQCHFQFDPRLQRLNPRYTYVLVLGHEGECFLFAGIVDLEHGFGHSRHNNIAFEFYCGAQVLACVVLIVLQGVPFQSEEPFPQALRIHTHRVRANTAVCAVA